MNTTRKPYPTDLTDHEGQLIEPRLPKRVYGTKPKHPHAKSSTPSSTSSPPTARMLPHDFPPYTPVSYHFHRVSARFWQPI